MNWVTLLKSSIKYIRYNKMRSLLTTLGIVIGVSTVIAIMSFLQGLNNSVEQEFSALGAKTIYLQKTEYTIGTRRRHLDFDEMGKRPNLTIEDAEAIAELDSVYVTAPTMDDEVGTLTRGANELEDCSLEGTTEGAYYTSNWSLESGRFLTREDGLRRSMICVIGYYVAYYLFGGEDPLGQMLEVDGHRYRVVGVLSEKGMSFGHSQDTLVLIPYATYKKYYDDATGRRSLFHGTKIEILPGEGVTVEEALKDIEELMRLRRGLRYTDDNDFGLNTQESMLSSINEITSILWLVMVGVGTISLLVGGIGIMNIMLVSVTERTREIGIRKAIGARDRDILYQFLLESVLLSLIGGIIGIALGVGVSQIVSAMGLMDAETPLWSVSVGFGFSALVGISFGIYPARKASNLNPIDAIRYE